MADAKRDSNRVNQLMGVSNADNTTLLPIKVDSVTGRILCSVTGIGSGTVTTVSVTSANGFSGTVATATTTPAITISTTITGILKGNGTAISAASAGTDYVIPGLATASGLTMNTAKILGRATAAAGAIEEIAVTGSGSVVLSDSPTLTTPALGTPSALVGTNITGTASGLTAGSVSRYSPASGSLTLTGDDAITFTTTDTTALTLPITGTLATLAGTETLTNKRVTKRTGTTTSSATPTINTDNVDFYSITAQTENITSFTTNLSGTPTGGQTLWIAITGTAARAITWGASFESSTVTLPNTTVSTNRLDVGFVWNTVTSKWRCVATC